MSGQDGNNEMLPLHRQRGVAESFGIDPQRYDRTRARCPQDLIDRFVELAAGRSVVDVGCGTGIVSRQLLDAGCMVLGVEPDSRMAEYARTTGVAVELSAFESWEPNERRFGLVVASESWHWVEPYAGAAKAADSLAPGGWLAPFWHTYELPPSVARAYDMALRQVRPDSMFTPWFGAQRADAYSKVFDSVTEGIARTQRFEKPTRLQIDWEQSYTRDQWLDRMPTQGTLDSLSPDDQLTVLDNVGAAIDELGGMFRVSNSTVAIVARAGAVID